MPKDFPRPWRYVFVRGGNEVASCKHPACPCSQSDATLKGSFRVMCGKKSHECLYEALLSSGFKKDKAVAMMVDFLSKQLGIEPYQSVPHVLVGHGFYRQWVGSQSNRLFEIQGKIVQCSKIPACDALSFAVEYDEEAIQRIDGLTSPCTEITESDAWRGALDFEKKRKQCPVLTPPLRYSWLVPTHREYRHCGPSTTLLLDVNGFRLVFTAKESSIPNAGLGLFVGCDAQEGTSPETNFVLQPGCLLDIGPYATLSSDRKTTSSSYTKGFLFEWKPGAWEFECMPSDSEFVFDVSCFVH